MCLGIDMAYLEIKIVVPLLLRLYIGIADGMSIARVWTCRYSK